LRSRPYSANRCAAHYGTTRHETPCDRRHTAVLTRMLTTRLTETSGSRQTHRSLAINDGVSEGTRTPDTQDHKGVVKLQPFLGVDEVFLARVLAELCLKGCDYPADVVPGAPVGSRHEDHAVVSGAAGQHGFDV
jgi:hypothetical protein